MGAEYPRLPICIDRYLSVGIYYNQTMHSPQFFLLVSKRSIPGYASSRGILTRPKMRNCLNARSLVYYANESMFLCFLFPIFFGSSLTEVFSWRLAPRPAVPRPPPMTCCPQAAMTTQWGKGSPRSHVCCCKSKAKQSFLLRKLVNTKNASQ